MASKADGTTVTITTVTEAFAALETACDRAVEIAEKAKVADSQASNVRAGIKNVRGMKGDARGRFALLARALGESD